MPTLIVRLSRCSLRGIYGKGKSVAFTSDANGRWSYYWVGWGKFVQFWSDVVDSVRPEERDEDEAIKFDLRYSVEKGALMLDLTVFSERAAAGVNSVLSFPDNSEHEVGFKSVSRGRFQARIDNAMAGTYTLNSQIGPKKLTPVAFSLSGELFGEKKGKGFRRPVLERLGR